MSFRRNGYGPIDRFCAKHPRFGIPNLMKILVIIQIVVYAVNFLTDLTLGYGLSFYLYFIPGALGATPSETPVISALSNLTSPITSSIISIVM